MTPHRRLGVAVTNGFLVALFVLTVVLATAEEEVTDAGIRNTHQRL